MPFKSEAQRRYFHWAKKEGKISPKTVREWEEHTPPGKKLPERIHKKTASVYLAQLRKLAVTTTPIRPKARSLLTKRPQPRRGTPPPSTMPGISEPMQRVLTRQAATAHAHAGSPLSGQPKKKIQIKFPSSRAGAQRLSGRLGSFIKSRTG